jgi:quercetin dioxygenase-like cupin family protein
MFRRTTFIIVALAALLGLIVGRSLATPVRGVSAETAMGPLVDRPLDVSMEFENGTKAEVELKTKGPILVAQQRAVVAPNGTIGWHSHPGPTVVTIFSGTMSFYHAEDCTERITFEAGDSFSNLPDEIHLARNEDGAVPLVFFASYYLPPGTPLSGIRINRDSPGEGCPE